MNQAWPEEQAKCGADVPERESPLMSALYQMGEQIERLQKTASVMERQLRPVICDTPRLAPQPSESKAVSPTSEAVLRIHMLTSEVAQIVSRINNILDSVEV